MVAKSITRRLRIFTCSWSDFFLETADEWRAEAWSIIKAHPEFDWLILTKRIDRVHKCLPEDWGDGWENVWLGISAENQQRWNERVFYLQKIPAKIRFVSAEPLLGFIDITQGLYRNLTGKPAIDWLIMGGESGNENGKWLYRPAQLIWFTLILQQCRELQITPFIKQLGTSIAKHLGLKNRAAEKLEQWPQSISHLKVQELPLCE